ncbi:S8 family serine peptidase [Oceanithermus sp.]|uniref:S8 family peptidase n=1 Tax=Oceanithermus sp. TaxID=2268145 RepID=UPI00257E7432|nr:S8 family serine peptidase [Oceanithermus sp.]
MKRIHWTMLAALGFLIAACSTQPPQANRGGAAAPEREVTILADHVTDQIVVGYSDPADLEALVQVLDEARVIRTIPQMKAALVELPAGTPASAALAKLKHERIAGLRYAQPNYTHPLPDPVQNAAPLGMNDPLEAQKWDHDVMQAEAAWATAIDGALPDGSGVVIGVVDTGIDGTHPDLAGAFVNGFDAVGCSTYGVIPPGFDASQGQIHGTHVAGIAAARGNNGQGVAGVAPNATLMDLQVFCGGSTDDFTIAVAVIAAIFDLDGDGVVPDVITMSLGGKGYGQLLKDVLDSAMSGYNVITGAALPGYDDGTAGGTPGDGVPDRSVIFTVAMGNSAQDEVQYPAGYPGIVAVGATNARDEKADFSTSGGHISVGAPGVDILSTWPTWDRDATGRPYLYYRISGTSMATPQVAGAAALVKQFLPGASAYEVKRLLEVTADDIGPAGFDRGSGWGRVNLKRLVDRVAAVRVGSESTEKGAVASVMVLTENPWDSNGDGAVDPGTDERAPVRAVDVHLIRDGAVKYTAKTNGRGMANFVNIAPGTYKVMVSGQDITDGAAMAFWPYERVSWDVDGDPGNGITLGSLDVLPCGGFENASPLVATLSSTLQATLSWTGGGDLDLAVYEYDPALGVRAWHTAKTGALWGSFDGDDPGADPTHASETYTLDAVHYPSLAGGYYHISIDASGAAVGTTATLTLSMNGVTKSYGPIPVTPGSTAFDNDLDLLFTLIGFDNWPTVY